MKTITLVDTEFQYNSQEELELILKKYPNIKFLGSYEIGDYFTAGDRFTAGNDFAAGDGLDVIKCFSGNGMYKYHSGAIITKTGEKWIILGCFCRKLGDWEKEFWNNDKEFPNDGSEASENRLKAYKVAKYWLELNS